MPRRERTPEQKRRRRRWKRGLLLGLFVLLIAGITDYYAYPYGAWTTGQSGNRGENGLWLRYTWYFGEKTPAEVAALPRRLKDHQIRYAYFHVRSITEKGTLKYRYPDRAHRLIDVLHRDAPDVKAIAWVYAASKRGEGAVADLTNSAVRKQMVEEAVWLVTACGFDGIQWDYEICLENEPGFLPLLGETRAALPPDKIVSVAAPVWMPFPLGRLGWSEDYFAQVARHCDQMAVMVYDAGFVLPRSHAWLTHQQAIHVTNAVAKGNPNCRVLLGIPTYGTGFPSHNPRAENIAIALKGARDGFADPRTNRTVFAGVAPFADYTTDEAEWETYRRMWPVADDKATR